MVVARSNSFKGVDKGVDRRDVHRSFFDYAAIGKQKLFSEHPVCQRLSNPELVVYSGFESLLAADVALDGLHGHMTEEKLNLFKFSPGGMESRAQDRRRSCGES